MRTAICPGSFDPITKGHVDIIERAAALFDRVIVLISHNPDKKPVFSVSQRVDFVKRSVAHLPNVQVDHHAGLLAEYLSHQNACAIVKGLRAMSDFESEFQMALANKTLNPAAETVFLTTRAENMYLSSSLVRQLAGLGANIAAFVPPAILSDVQKTLQGETNNDGK